MNLLRSIKMYSSSKLLSNFIKPVSSFCPVFHCQYSSSMNSLSKKMDWKKNYVFPISPYSTHLLSKNILCSPHISTIYTSNVRCRSNSFKKEDKGAIRGAFSWKSLLFASVFGGILLIFVLYVKKEKELVIERERKRNLGKMKIGGSFKLIDHEGKPQSSDDFLGQWCLIYFGFTHCPDICPDELEKMGNVVDIINKNPKMSNIQPIFITVDPQRDDVKAVKAYVKEFHPDMIGLTGSIPSIAEACKNFRVYFSSGPKDEDEDYIVDHTIIMYLVDPNFDFVDYYGQNKNATQITDSIQLNMAKFEQLQKTGFKAVLNL